MKTIYASGPNEATSDMHQGSIIVPALVTLYINDIMYSCPAINTEIYADDSTLMIL